MVLVPQTDGASVSSVLSPTDSVSVHRRGVRDSADCEGALSTDQGSSCKVGYHVTNRMRTTVYLPGRLEQSS